MDEPKKEMTLQEKSVLSLLQAHAQSKKDAIDTLQRKAQYNFTTINILAAVVAGFSRDYPGPVLHPAIAGIPILLVVLMGLVYVVVGVLSIRALWVKVQRSVPMQPDENTVDEWLRCTTEHHKKLLRDSYLQVYADIDKLANAIARQVEWGQKFIMFGIIIFIAQALISLPPVIDIINSLIADNM